MQEVIIKVREGLDLQFLLMFLEKMQYSFVAAALPEKAVKKAGESKKNGLKPSEKFNGKLLPETADAMLAQTQSGQPNSKNNTIENLLAKLGDYYDPEFADNIEEAQKHWKNWTIETW